MTGPVDTSQSEPLDQETFRHQLLLLKSLHCARPILHEGAQKFISGVSAYASGSDIKMVVYLAGRTGGIDCSEVQIKKS